MCAAASLMLGLMHLSFWLVGGRAPVYLLSALMAFAAGAGALPELAMMRVESIAVYITLYWGLHLTGPARRNPLNTEEFLIKPHHGHLCNIAA